MLDCEVFIGWDTRQRLAWQVCARSILAHAKLPPPIRPIGLKTLGDWYRRPTDVRDGVLFDTVSGAPMSTEFALARFFVPFAARTHWALFVDGDFLFRADVAELLEQADQRYAVQVVMHSHQPHERVKMDAQPQSAYARKNWSSCVLWNLRHAGNGPRFGVTEANTKPGLWLHQFAWLQDHEIGALPPGWNWIDGWSAPDAEPKAVHFTAGVPPLVGDTGPYSAEWRQHLTAGER